MLRGHDVTTLASAEAFGPFGNLLAARPVPSCETTMPQAHPAEPADHELLTRSLAGDTEAFAALYRRYARPVFNLLLRTAGERALAEELLQETFTRVWLAGRTFDPTRGPFRPWLFTIALNLMRSELVRQRHKRPHVPLDEQQIDPVASAAAEDWAQRLDLSRQARAVADALGALPDHQREVVVLRCYQQLSFAEIAAVTGAPEGTLKARFHRAVAVLKARLGARGPCS
jgi:RNA polymerase sigma-70 factor, ECF subfamily